MMRWFVEICHIVRLQDHFSVPSLHALRISLQSYADSYRPREGKPPLGELSYRYEMDDQDLPCVIHVYFTNSKGHSQRFARLRIDHAES